MLDRYIKQLVFLTGRFYLNIIKTFNFAVLYDHVIKIKLFNIFVEKDQVRRLLGHDFRQV